MKLVRSRSVHAARLSTVPETHFDEWIARRYRRLWPEAFEPPLLDAATAFLAGLARSGPALEFGIGTGRVAAPPLLQGVPVNGIELSPAMVAELKRQPHGSDIDVTIGDFATTNLNSTFRVVYLLRNTITNLTTQAEQVQCFANAARHLGPGGFFVIENYVPGSAAPARGDHARLHRHARPRGHRRVRPREPDRDLAPLVDHRRGTQDLRFGSPLRVAFGARSHGCHGRHDPPRAVERLVPRTVHERKPKPHLGLADRHVESRRSDRRPWLRVLCAARLQAAATRRRLTLPPARDESASRRPSKLASPWPHSQQRPPDARGKDTTMRELLVDFITSLDGYASGEGWPGFWGLEGPEYLAWLGEQPEVTYLMGANTYRLMSGFAAGEVPAGQDEFTADEETSVDELTRASKVVFSASLPEPLTWANSTLVRDDAVEVVQNMKESDSGLISTIGSVSLCQSLIRAGLVDRFRVVMFPVITGATGEERIYDGYPDVALEMTDHRTFDGRIQLVEYRPRVLEHHRSPLRALEPATSDRRAKVIGERFSVSVDSHCSHLHGAIGDDAHQMDEGLPSSRHPRAWSAVAGTSERNAMDAVIIECAINGTTSKRSNPYVPVSPEEIAIDALACIEAGASIIHNHIDRHGISEAEAAERYLEGWRPVLAERPDALLYPTVHLGEGISYEHLVPLAAAGLRVGLVDPAR